MIDDGGPAFPFESRQVGTGVLPLGAHPGMSLRDWFAGQALALLLHAYGVYGVETKLDANSTRKELAVEAYLLADAMLAARKQ